MLSQSTVMLKLNVLRNISTKYASSLLYNSNITVCRCLATNVKSTDASKEVGKKQEGPKYVTKNQFLNSVNSSRTREVFDAETGYKPSNWQKFCLVLTNLYSSKKEIPEYVGPGTMQRMHNRMRVVFIIVACVWFYLLFLVVERGTASFISKEKGASRVAAEA
ncbi:hypothetical protein AB6A40_001544 [Gnathostoma spinigerum]|uniref:Uncharacterized protein n=1 Tax=Gnathostoma spinigerum TaxID=75299 RepID=A0ABD6EES6_9BILA